MDSQQESLIIPENYYETITLYKDNKSELYVDLLNDTDDDVKYKEGKITRITQSEYQVSTEIDKIIFPGGLTVGEKITVDKIIELFGEPTDIYEYSSDGYESLTYTYNADTSWESTNYFEIKVVNGVIDEITLDNRNYK